MKGEGCCTWNTETKWTLGDADLLEVGGAYRFRVRAVNLMGASEPSPPSPILHWPPTSKPGEGAAQKQEGGEGTEGAGAVSKEGAGEARKPTKECGSLERDLRDPFTSFDVIYMFQSKPQPERLIVDDTAAVTLHKLLKGCAPRPCGLPLIWRSLMLS